MYVTLKHDSPSVSACRNTFERASLLQEATLQKFLFVL
jgi:hypothetical protein